MSLPTLPLLHRTFHIALTSRNNLLPGGNGAERGHLILQPVPTTPQLLLLQKKFVQPSVLCTRHPTPSYYIHSCLAPSGPWFTAGLGLQPADRGLPWAWARLGAGHQLALTRPVLSLLEWSSALSPLVCLLETLLGEMAASFSSAAFAGIPPERASGHHFPLLLQSLGVKCRHLESIQRRSRLSIARSCHPTCPPTG